MKRYVLGCIGSLAIALLGAAPGINAAGDDTRESDTSKTTDQEAAATSALVGKRRFIEEIRAPGEVRPNAYASIVVGPRVPAQVVARHVRMGDQVKSGQPLVALAGVAIAEAQAALIVADREWKRVRELGADAVSGRRFTEARVAYDQAIATLRAEGMSEGQIGDLLQAGSAQAAGTIELLAPRAGRITSDEFVLGEYVEPGRVLVTIVDTSTVWIEARLPPEQAGRIALHAPARVALNGDEMQGTVVQRAESVEEASRTVMLRIEAANPHDALVPGQFVEIRIAAGGTQEVLAVPAEALTQINGQLVVFARRQGGKFEPVPVRTGETRDGWTVILEGIAEGDTIAVSGIYDLKAKLLRQQINADDD